MNPFLNQIERKLEELVQEKDPHLENLASSTRYCLLSPGKRLRPLLALTTTLVLGGDPEKALTPACALEMIHSYSLVHDDLPCMDDDDFRRGIPSLHKAYNEGHAVLTGDFLLTRAFEVIAKESNVTPEQKVALVQILAHHAGSAGMIGGQVMDLSYPTPNREILQTIQRKKTGALITAAVEFGCIIAGASPHEKETLTKFGQNIGLAFQIVDDILDQESYVNTQGEEAVKTEADTLLQEAITLLNSLERETKPLENLATQMTNRKV